MSNKKLFWIIGFLGLIAAIFFSLSWIRRSLSTIPSPSSSPLSQIEQQPNPSPVSNPTDPNDMIVLEAPLEGNSISSPLTISGKARGNWFFEASFPVVLTDWDGRIIAEGVAMTSDEWMTTEYVPFTATLTFETPSYGERGTLILKKDNPSGLPENDAAYEITVLFEQQ